MFGFGFGVSILLGEKELRGPVSATLGATHGWDKVDFIGFQLFLSIVYIMGTSQYSTFVDETPGAETLKPSALGIKEVHGDKSDRTKRVLVIFVDSFSSILSFCGDDFLIPADGLSIQKLLLYGSSILGHGY